MKKEKYAKLCFGVGEVQQRVRKEQVFHESLITGLCGDICNIFKKDYIVTKPYLVATEEAAAEPMIADSPAPETETIPEPNAVQSPTLATETIPEPSAVLSPAHATETIPEPSAVQSPAHATETIPEPSAVQSPSYATETIQSL